MPWYSKNGKKSTFEHYYSLLHILCCQITSKQWEVVIIGTMALTPLTKGTCNTFLAFLQFAAYKKHLHQCRKRHWHVKYDFFLHVAFQNDMFLSHIATIASKAQTEFALHHCVVSAFYASKVCYCSTLNVMTLTVHKWNLRRLWLFDDDVAETEVYVGGCGMAHKARVFTKPVYALFALCGDSLSQCLSTLQVMRWLGWFPAIFPYCLILGMPPFNCLCNGLLCMLQVPLYVYKLQHASISCALCMPLKLLSHHMLAHVPHSGPTSSSNLDLQSMLKKALQGVIQIFLESHCSFIKQSSVLHHSRRCL